ncbi:MAG: acyl-CoA thioesterase [Burkholderiales bacterium]|jgi:acyl-CoA thioesterase YciA|nr:acyl-CoA thioesterase [Burkholderiales bacterium]MCE3268993.1 acyl-CoA thioesterase [Burkholderiales bacterium]
MKKYPVNPTGDLVIKTLAMPGNTNSNGDIFGGWVLSQMDLGGGIIAKTYSPSGRVVTVAIESMSFINPISVGESVSCYAKVIEFGRSSMKIQIETWVYNYLARTQKIVTNGVFTYVAVDEHGKPILINKLVNHATR